MDLTFGEEQELIRSSVRDFLQTECPTAHVRAMEDDDRGYSEALWRQMAELGWMGMALPERHGGVGMSFQQLCLVLEEQGRFRLPGPFFSTVVLCALPIARFGTEAQKSQYLRAIASGGRIMSYAEMEPVASWDPSRIALAAKSDGNDGYLLEGTKRFVPYAHVADQLLVAARSDGSGERGLTLLLVDAASPGLELEPLETIAGGKQYQVAFDDVRVPQENVLGRAGEAWPMLQAIHAWGAAGKCAEMIGGAQKVLEMTLDYAQERQQFGRPIGSFQAVQHHCANMAVDVLSAQFIAYEAIWRVSEGMDAAPEVSMAKAWVSETYQRVCALGHQVHGAIGFTHEHDMQLFSRHAKAAALAFGDADHHRERVAQQLGL